MVIFHFHVSLRAICSGYNHVKLPILPLCWPLVAPGRSARTGFKILRVWLEDDIGLHRPDMEPKPSYGQPQPHPHRPSRAFRWGAKCLCALFYEIPRWNILRDALCTDGCVVTDMLWELSVLRRLANRVRVSHGHGARRRSGSAATCCKLQDLPPQRPTTPYRACKGRAWPRRKPLSTALLAPAPGVGAWVLLHNLVKSPLLNGPASTVSKTSSVSCWIGRLPMQLSQRGLATKLLHLWSCGLLSAVLVRELAIYT